MAVGNGQNRPIRVGIVGSNYGAATHIPACLALPEFDVVAVATHHRDTADATAQRWALPRAHVGFEALCDEPDIDLVCVATRPSRHLTMVETALRAGKHVLCEAPLARNAREGGLLCEAADKAGTVALVDLQSRFSPGLWEFRRRVQEGWLGTVHNVHATAFYPTFTVPEKVRPSAWCADATTGASSLRVHGLHTADLIRWIFGEMSDVRGTVGTRVPQWNLSDGSQQATSADSATFTARVADGALCSVHTSWVSWHGSGWRLEAYGSEGFLLATAAGHTGHSPVTLRGARWDEESVRDLPHHPETYDVSEVPSDAPHYPLARLLRRFARSTSGSRNLSVQHGTIADVVDPDLPRFEDGRALLTLADEVENT